jgi:hypothetical protein
MTRDRPRNGLTRKRGRPLALSAALGAALTALLLPLSGSALPQAAPLNTSPPTITGTAEKDETLVGSTGSWSGTTPISFAFEWQRCDENGANCAAIGGATNTTYLLDDPDVGKRVRILVTATNADGASSALSEASAVVADGGAPQSTAEPVVSGAAREGQRLTTTTGTWAGDQPLTFGYQWVRCGADGGLPDGSNCTVVAGATASSYTLVAADVGSRMRVRVTATNSAGSATAASNPTQSVSRGAAPVNTRRPSVRGNWVEGQTATLDRGAWTGAASFSYQWLRCNSAGGSCSAIGGATGTTYRLTSADVGRKVRANVTARNSAGSTTVTSTESGTVQAVGPAGIVVLPTGERSIPVTSVPSAERLVVSQVRFAPNPVRSRTQPIGIEVKVKDTRGYVVRDALVFVRSTPLVTRAAQPRRPTQTNGVAVFQMLPRAGFFPTPRRGYNVQFFVKAYRSGDRALAGVAGYRLVQVRLAG